MEINDQTFSTAASGGPYTSIPSGDIGTVIRFYINWASYLHLKPYLKPIKVWKLFTIVFLCY